MEKILIIAAIIFFAIVIIKNLGNNKTNKDDNREKIEGIGIKFPKIFNGNNNNNEENRRNSDETFRFSEWTVYVLDKEGNVLNKKSMSATCEKPFSIGYDKDCDLVVKSDFVSRVHLKIGKDKDGYFAKDCSLNGTFVNDKEYKGESFSLEEGLVYVADIPVYFEKNNPDRPVISPRFTKKDAEVASKDNDIEDMSNTKNFGNTRTWGKKKDGSSVNSPISR